jgi:hypothetical protein
MPRSDEPADDLHEQDMAIAPGDSSMGGTGLEPVTSCL